MRPERRLRASFFMEKARLGLSPSFRSMAMPHKILPFGAATALAFAATVSCAGVEVRFVEPDKYVDVRDFAGYRDQQRVLDEIQAHFQALGDTQLPPPPPPPTPTHHNHP